MLLPIMLCECVGSDTVFLNLCPLYWERRFAGYGNKSPSQ
jgi:hypothetical protein